MILQNAIALSPRPHPRHRYKDKGSHKGLFKRRQYLYIVSASELSLSILHLHILSLSPTTMAPKYISFPVFAILIFAYLSLLACASPIPVILPPSEGITLFKDVIARDVLLEVNMLTREPALLLELHEADAVLVRDEDAGLVAEPSILVDDPGDALEARICRYGCL
ncbi:uncharacterized protein HD556DRAFT_1370989 [Suillus plorans]|uniref:Uncharacterized protein n=1 Tax=Suillus plorans TaxID=116603 RepID=A0A9P7AQ24_9AGAM|nr:uncharacterized protein HD556DRAFT_1370989 [Suillus plorans]KAG1794105.1 hypothetical protein HD556DRAFT_1370989 [Suillus plorans]